MTVAISGKDEGVMPTRCKHTRAELLCIGLVPEQLVALNVLGYQEAGWWTLSWALSL